MTSDSIYVERFSRTERAVHWIHASAFFVLLGTGLVLYVPRLSALVARRPLIKDIHVYTVVAWIALLRLVVALGDRAVCDERFAISICSMTTTVSGWAEAEAARPFQRWAEAACRSGRGLCVALRGLRVSALAR
jgi:hypothetical protein